MMVQGPNGTAMMVTANGTAVMMQQQPMQPVVQMGVPGAMVVMQQPVVYDLRQIYFFFFSHFP